MEVNFDSLPKVSGGTAKLVNPGDKIEGTLVGKKLKPDQFNPGKEVMICEIQDAQGRIWTYWANKPGIISEMSNVRLGQYVKVQFTKIVPSKTPGFQDKKVIEVFSDPSLVNKEWLAENAEEEEIASVAESFGGSVVTGTGPVTSDGHKLPNFAEEINSKEPTELEQIKNLAKLKIPGITEENFKDKIIESTGIAFIPLNYKRILDLLK